jgi:hypothetical protein
VRMPDGSKLFGEAIYILYSVPAAFLFLSLVSTEEGGPGKLASGGGSAGRASPRGFYVRGLMPKGGKPSRISQFTGVGARGGGFGCVVVWLL